MGTSSNIYGYSRNRMLEEYRTRISGSDSGLFLALSTAQLEADARVALVKSAESLGYGPDGATFLAIDKPEALSPEQLFEIAEGLDPLCIVIADAQAAALFANAYHIILPTRASFRTLGREIRLLPNLGSMMATPAGKQQAWAALKTLPHLGK